VSVVVASEQGGKHGPGIEARPAQPVDRTIPAHERSGLAIADQTIVFDALSHGPGVRPARKQTARSTRSRELSSGRGSRRSRRWCGSLTVSIPGTWWHRSKLRRAKAPTRRRSDARLNIVSATHKRPTPMLTIMLFRQSGLGRGAARGTIGSLLCCAVRGAGERRRSECPKILHAPGAILRRSSIRRCATMTVMSCVVAAGSFSQRAANSVASLNSAKGVPQRIPAGVSPLFHFVVG
jgi:hypothetical protein